MNMFTAYIINNRNHGTKSLYKAIHHQLSIWTKEHVCSVLLRNGVCEQQDLPFLFSFHSPGLLCDSFIHFSSIYTTSYPSLLWKGYIIDIKENVENTYFYVLKI